MKGRSEGAFCSCCCWVLSEAQIQEAHAIFGCEVVRCHKCRSFVGFETRQGVCQYTVDIGRESGARAADRSAEGVF